MSDSSQHPPQEPPSPLPEPTPAAKRRPQNGLVWLGVGLVSAVGIALVASLASVWNQEAPAPAGAAPEGPVDSTAPPASLEEHQQLVAAVVNDLDREVLIGDSPTLGNPDADIVLLEFSDFQCPYCAQAAGQVKGFVGENADDVLFVYKHLPLTNIHSEALPAALASWAAGEQGKFWEFHDILFAQQSELGESLYVQTAEALGLNLEQFNRDRASEAAKAAVAKDLALAAELQLSGTPTFIMDEILIPGAVPPEFFTEALARLKAAQ